MESQQYLIEFIEHCKKLDNYYNKRDVMIAKLFDAGVRQKVLSVLGGLSLSRVKGIVMEQRKISGEKP